MADTWLVGNEATSLLTRIQNNRPALKIIEDYFADWQSQPMDISEIMKYFLIGYLAEGTADGQALQTNPASSLVRCVLEDKNTKYLEDRLPKARDIRDSCPAAFQWMLTLICKHAEICQSVLRSSFNSHVLNLQRGVSDTTNPLPIESWSFNGSVSSYGPITLQASVPLASVLSLRGQEHEIVLIRHSWELSIIERAPEKTEPNTESWREQLAKRLENLANLIRCNGNEFRK